MTKYEEARARLEEHIRETERTYNEEMTQKFGFSEGDIIDYEMTDVKIRGHKTITMTVRGIFNGWHVGAYGAPEQPTMTAYRKDGSLSAKNTILRALNNVRLVKKLVR